MHRLFLSFLLLLFAVSPTKAGTGSLAESIEDVMYLSSVGVFEDRLFLQFEATANDTRSDPFEVSAAVGSIPLNCEQLNNNVLACDNDLTAGFTYRVCLYLPAANVRGINLQRGEDNTSRCLQYVAQ